MPVCTTRKPINFSWQVSSYGRDEELHLEVRVEYMCEATAARNTLAGSIPGSRAGR